MSARGITSSDLYDRALKRDRSSVPIGAPVITHDTHRMSPEVQALIRGETLTEPTAAQIQVEGFDGKEVGRNDRRSVLRFQSPEKVNERRIVEASFNPKTGEIVLVRENQEVVLIPEFMRADQLGVGPTGPRGERGQDARNGHDGRDGADGDVGCAGPEGKPGTVGESGGPGKDGPPGTDGHQGCDGPVGDSGGYGAMGRHGYEGPRGLRGPSCASVDEEGNVVDNSGGIGPAGLAFGEGVVFGTLASAAMSVAIIGLDDDGIDSTYGAAPPYEPPPYAPPVTPPPPPTPPSVPAPPPPAEPPPKPRPAAAFNLCLSRNAKVSELCGAMSTFGREVFANWAGPNGTYGLSPFPTAGHVHTGWWNIRMATCSKLAGGNSYIIELTTPTNVGAMFYVGCAWKVTIPQTGGSVSITVDLEEDADLSVRLMPTGNKVLTWVSIRILDAASRTVLYTSGTGREHLEFQDSTGGRYRPVMWHRDIYWRSVGNNSTIGGWKSP